MMGRTTFVLMVAEHEGIKAARRNHVPPRDPPNTPDYQTSVFTTPTSYAGVMAAEQAPIWCDFDVA